MENKIITERNVEDDFSRPIKVDIEKLMKYCGYGLYGWNLLKIKESEIEERIKKNKLEYRVCDLFIETENVISDHTDYDDIGRVAYFVENGQDDPIFIDFLNDMWPISDGNHRLRAALHRKDKWILASCSGYTSMIKSFVYYD